MFEHDSGVVKDKIARVNGKYHEYSYLFGGWKKMYDFKLLDARKELKYFLTSEEYEFSHIVIDNSN